MTETERAILMLFRRYKMGPHSMLFFHSNVCTLGPRKIRTAMQTLISRGLVVKERPNDAYSLTQTGYTLSLSVPCESRS